MPGTLGSRELSASTIRRKLSAMSSVFDYVCGRNAMAGNQVDGVKRPTANGNEGSTPACPIRRQDGEKASRSAADDTLKGVRNWAILATFLYHGVKDLQSQEGLNISAWRAWRGKIRHVFLHPMAQTVSELRATGRA